MAIKRGQGQQLLGTRAKDPVYRPSDDENLAIIQTMFGENSHAISTLKRLLQTPYMSWLGRHACYAGAFEARSDLGSVARRSRFPKTLRRKAAVIGVIRPIAF